MPHESRYSKTRDGYILEVETLLDVQLPKAYYRLSIAAAEELHQCALFIQSSPQRFFDFVKKNKLPRVLQEPPTLMQENPLLTKKDWKLIRNALQARRKKLAIHAHTWERAGIGSEAAYTEYTQIMNLLSRLEAV